MLRVNDFVHFFADGIKLKILSEIYPTSKGFSDLKACLDYSDQHSKSLWKFEFSHPFVLIFHDFLHGIINN